MSFDAIPATPVRKTLHDVVLETPSLIAADPWAWWAPLVRWLAQLHAQGRPHGALLHASICLDASGQFDLPYLESLEGRPPLKDSSFRFYYPTSGQALASDLHALAVAFYFGIVGSTPAVGQRSSISLTDYEPTWPSDFLRLTEWLITWPTELSDAVQLQEKYWPATSDASSETVPEPLPETVAADLPEFPEAILAEPVLFTEADLPEPPHIELIARLPNTTTGRTVHHELQTLVTHGHDAVARMQVVGELPDGFSFDGQVLSGVPTTSGEFTLTFECALSGFPPVTRSTLLTINPDPRSLWKDLPPDESKPYLKPNTAHLALDQSPLPVVAASRRGRSHAHEGTFRDDDFAIDWFPTHGWYLLAVADGAGSAKFSRKGSQIACETVQRLLGQQFSATTDTCTTAAANWASEPNEETERTAKNEFYRVLGSAALKARQAIEEEAHKAGATARDFNTTLIVVLARPFPTGWFFASFSIGDGGAGLAGVPEEVNGLLTTADGGEFAGQTVFLTMKEAMATGAAVLKRLRLTLAPSFQALMVMTDGVTDPKFASDDALAQPGPWNELWAELRPVLDPAQSRAEQSAALLEWLNFWSTGNHDDRTIAILYQPPPS